MEFECLSCVYAEPNCQFINENFELTKVVLHSQEFPGSHTAEALAVAFRDMFQEWGIPQEKVHVILRDNTRNMEKAMREFWHSVPSLMSSQVEESF